MTSKHIHVLTGALLATIISAMSANAGTLDDVKQRGVLRCGVGVSVPGFTYPDAQGVRRGFDIEFCHAIAAAVLGDAKKVEITAMAPRDAFPRLTTGTTDVLTHRFTATLSRDNGVGMQATVPYFYDGQGFIVRKNINVEHLKDLGGASICVALGTTTELNIADYFNSHKIPYKNVTFESPDAARVAYDQGRCDVFSNDRSSLVTQRMTMSKPDDHIVLAETISLEPIGPLVRQGDPAWAHVVKWTLYATIQAEFLGLTSVNVDQMKTTSQSPVIKRFLGVSDDMGQKLGLSRDWAYNIVKQVGNYGEIFNRNIGANSPMKIERGRNALWSEGGLMVSPPFL